MPGRSWSPRSGPSCLDTSTSRAGLNGRNFFRSSCQAYNVFKGRGTRLSAMAKTRVLLADDHVVVATALGGLLKERFDVVGTVHDGRALLEAAERLRPDVIVTDISMPQLNGLEAIRQIRARFPDIKIVVLTMYAEAETAVAAFRAGARGYVLKVSPEEEFISAIQQVVGGHAYISP